MTDTRPETRHRPRSRPRSRSRSPRAIAALALAATLAALPLAAVGGVAPARAEGWVVTGDHRYWLHPDGNVTYTSPAGTFTTVGAVRAEHARHGGGDGALGYPTGWPVGEGEARTYQQFEHGVVYTSPSGTFAVTGGAAALHRDHGGGGGSLGYPTARGISESVTHGYQTFEHGIVYTSPRGSVTIPSPAVRGVHESRLGGRGPLGYPVAAPVQQAPRYSYQEF